MRAEFESEPPKVMARFGRSFKKPQRRKDRTLTKEEGLARIYGMHSSTPICPCAFQGLTMATFGSAWLQPDFSAAEASPLPPREHPYGPLSIMQPQKPSGTDGRDRGWRGSSPAGGRSQWLLEKNFSSQILQMKKTAFFHFFLETRHLILGWLYVRMWVKCSRIGDWFSLIFWGKNMFRDRYYHLIFTINCVGYPYYSHFKDHIQRLSEVKLDA